MSLGPLQIMVVNFEDTNFTGEIEAELIRLEENGIVRVLDLLFVVKSPEGDIEVVRTHDVHSGALGQAILDRGKGVNTSDDPDVHSVADSIAPGNAAAIMVLEHRWTIPLHDAIATAGGVGVTTQWVEEAELASLGVALPTD